MLIITHYDFKFPSSYKTGTSASVQILIQRKEKVYSAQGKSIYFFVKERRERDDK